jgi:hypothetical protein
MTHLISAPRRLPTTRPSGEQPARRVVLDEGDALDDVVGRELVGHARERLLLGAAVHVRVAVGLDRLAGQALGDDLAPRYAARILPCPLARTIGEAGGGGLAAAQREPRLGDPARCRVWIFTPPPSRFLRDR